MNRFRWILAAGIVACFSAAGWIARDLGERRDAEGIGVASQEGERDPLVFFSEHLGAFRPIFVDALWLMADDRMRQSRWWELRSLYELISKLQPYNEVVWNFNAWNLTHNIPAHMKSPETKWPWMREGIEFLKEGQRKNPGSWLIPYHLGFLLYETCDREEVWRREAVEAFGEPGETLFEVAVRHAEEARSHPDHEAVVCILLLDIAYPYVLAEAIERGDEAVYRQHRARAEEARRHAILAHPGSFRDLRGGLPSRGQVLEKMGFKHFRDARFDRARRTYELAREAYRDEGDIATAEVLQVMVEMTEAVIEGIFLQGFADRFGASGETILGQAGLAVRVEGAFRFAALERLREVRELPERRLLHAWLPRCLPLEPEGAICQGRYAGFPSILELMYQYALRWVPPRSR